MSVEKMTIFNKKALKLSTNRYEAIIVPEYGCNVISLFDRRSRIPILRKPLEGDQGEFLSSPQHFGNAILFPPNRIEGGTYEKNGMTYSFVPENLTAKEQGNYVYSHGILRFMEFSVDSCAETADSITLKTSYHSREGGEIHKNFPHEFICRMTFVLSDAGLTETTCFENKSTQPMPLGVGFHTAFWLPWNDDSKREDYRLVLSAGEHIVLNEQHLATGERRPLSSPYRLEGILPFEPIADEHTSALALRQCEKDFHGAIIRNISTKHNIYFETSANLGYWMVWNNQAKSDYVCIEPMSWIVNAPNIPLPDEKTGYTQIEPGGEWSATLSLWAE